MNRRLLLFVLLVLLALTVTTVSAQSASNFTVTFGGRVFTGTQTTFTYIVSGTGTPPDLSHFDLEIPVCEPLLDVVAYAPVDAVSFGTDPTTGINGIKWDVPLLVTETRVYSLTFAGNVGQGTVSAAVKGGNGFTLITVPGPSCTSAAVSIQKYVSTDGLTWQDANTAPGPQAALAGQVSFRFVVTNTGIVPLSGIILADSVFDTSACAIPDSLAPEAFFECVIGPLAVTAGQHGNTASVTAAYEGVVVTASDDAFYFGGDLPQISINKALSVDGGDWQDANTAVTLDPDATYEIRFRFTVSNPGTVPLTNLTLSDTSYATTSCELPAALAPAAEFECVIGPFPAEDGAHANIATATGASGGLSVSASDSASYVLEQDDDDTELPVIIVIEGPVTAININIITIYDIDIQVSVDDPILTVIQIGDMIRVEGDYVSGGTTLVIIAVNIVIVDTDIVIIEDGDNPVVWRDDGACANPPPPWAPANGWRRRCESGSNDSGANPGRGRGDDDDDDD